MGYMTWFEKETDRDGAFVRQPNRFTTPFGVGAGFAE
jgi:hypothetical protein